VAASDRLTILVVEDEALVALDLEDLLIDLSHDVVATAASVDQALAFVRNADTMPDAAIVDANLGGKSARPVVDALDAQGVRVVVASGYGATDLARLGFESPSINKPYSARDIEAALLRVRASDEASTGGATD